MTDSACDDGVVAPVVTDGYIGEQTLIAAQDEPKKLAASEAKFDSRNAEETSITGQNEAKQLATSEESYDGPRADEMAAQDKDKDLAISDGNSDAGKRSLDVDVFARGIASVLGPVMNNFDGGVEGALKSQSILASSIDRLTRELDKLLEDVPHPYATHHATRLSGVRKRVLSLNTSLCIIQRRMDMIRRLLAGYASRAVDRADQVKASLSLVEGTHLSSKDVPLMELSPDGVSSGSPDMSIDDEEHSNVERSTISHVCGRLPSGGLQNDRLQDNVLASSNEEASIDQELNDTGTAGEARDLDVPKC